MITDVSPGIFRQYDIRGIFNKDLTTEIAMAIGAAYGVYLLKEARCKMQEARRFKVSVGRDVRLSSVALSDALIKGILSTGIDVIDIGECPTPLQYFSMFHLNLDGGIMITGSHNPPEFNGFKISIGRDTIYGESIQEIRRIIEQGSGVRGQGSGKIEHYDIISAYMDYIKRQFNGISDRPAIKVVIDAGNGIGGVVAPKLLRELGCDVIELFCEPDGNFPNHHPDPTIPDNLKDLIATVKGQKADMGIAYDGDADRLGVVDENGSIIWGDQLMIIFARDVLSQRLEVRGQRSGEVKKGTVPDLRTKRSEVVESGLSPKSATFVGEVKCSQIMYDEIQRLGGNAIMWKTGHSLIKSKMKETGAILAGEMSGHIFFADRYFGYDDAIYASCRLIEILARRRAERPDTTVSSLLANIPKMYSTPEIRVDCPDEKKFKVVERLCGIFDELKKNPELGIVDIITIDGLRIVFKDGWALVRASNTQPALVTRYEAVTEKRLQEIRKIGTDTIFR